jgi:3-hydroxyisobutyrate dehydrogenase
LLSPLPAVGVIGAGAMGMGVVRSLLRGRFATHVRDIRPAPQAEAVARGATGHASPASLVAACDIAIVLVVDAAQIDTVLAGPEGALATLRPGGVLVIASTVDPDYVGAQAARVRATGADLVDAPVSGGPQRAADGTMTLMCAGAASALARCEPVFGAIAARVFPVGSRPGDAAKFKIVNNLLAAANLAAGAEAMALARRLGLDPAQVVDVVNASSGGSWIFADRMPRALAGDYAPRAAARILAKDVGIAAALAARHGVEATFAHAAHAAFEATVAAGYGEADDAAIYAFRCTEARTAAPRPQPYAAVPAYVTKDGSTIRELAHPAVHGHRALSFAEATIPAGGTTRLHRHEASEEIYHVTAGHGRLVRGDETIAIAPGDTVVIPPRTPHSLQSEGPRPLVVLCACSPPYAHADTTLLDATVVGERAALLHGARPGAAPETRGAGSGLTRPLP